MTSIGDGAFSGCTGLEDINFPEGVTEISDSLFKDSVNLESIGDGTFDNITSIGNSAFENTKISLDDINNLINSNEGVSIGENAFSGVKGDKGETTPATLAIPSNVSSIGSGAFSGGNYDKVDVNSPLTGDNIFKGTTSLKEAYLADSTTDKIPAGTFDGCTSLDTLTWPNDSKITEIGENAFRDTALTELAIPEGVTTIGKDAFASMDDLKSVTIPDSINSDFINSGSLAEAFGNKPNTSVTELTVPSDLDEDALKELAEIFPNVEKITVVPAENDKELNGDFSGFGSLDEVVIGEGITGIDDNAFANSTISKADIPSSVGSIGKDIFEGCKNLEEVSISTDTLNSAVNAENNYTPIDLGDSSISKVTITKGSGESSEKIPENAFKGQSGLEEIVVDPGITEIGNSAFEGVSTVDDADDTLTVYLPEGIKTVGDNAFANAPKVGTSEDTGKLVIVGYEDTNGNGKFDKDSDKLLENKLPSSVTEIGNGAFKDSGLGNNMGAEGGLGGTLTGSGSNADITGGLLGNISGNLTIGDDAFNGTHIGPVVNIPEGTTGVGEGAFANITPSSGNGGISVNVPAEVTSNNKNEAGESVSLGDIFGNGTDVPVIDDLIISGNGNVGNLTGMTEQPKEGENAGLVLDNVVIKDGVTGIGDNAFTGVGTKDDLTVTLPDDGNFTTIGDNAFNGGPLSVDDNGKVISESSPADLSVGKNDSNGNFIEKLPSSVNEIGSGAFHDSGLGKGDENGGLGGTITNAGTPSASIEGGLLGDINGDLTIGDDAFNGTHIGPVVNIPEGTMGVGEGAFANITPSSGNGGVSVKVPAEVTSDNKNEAGDNVSLGDIFGNGTDVPVIDDLIISGNGNVGNLTGKDKQPSEGENAGLVLDNVVLEEGVTGIGDNAFTGVGTKDDLTVTLPNDGGFTTIGDNAFNGGPLSVDDEGKVIGSTTPENLDVGVKGDDGSLDEKLPSSVTEIGSGAFQDSGLGKDDEGGVDIPGFVPGGAVVGDNAFTGVGIGDTLVITDDINDLQDIKNIYGREELDSIKTLTVPIDLIDTDEKADALKAMFPNVENIIVTGSEGSNTGTVCGISNWKDSLASVDISTSGATGIGEGAFAGLKPDAEIKLTDTITSVCKDAFKGTTALDKEDFETLTVLESIGSGAFSNTGIGNVINIPETVTEIGSGAFSGLGGNTSDNALSVTLPAAVTENIDDFYTDSEAHDETVFIDSLTINGEGEIKQLAGNADKDDVPNTEPGTQAELVIGKVTVEEGITSIGENAFTGIGTSSGLLDVDLPESGLTAIKDGAFKDAPLLVDGNGAIQGSGDAAKNGNLLVNDDGKLPSSVTEIGDDAFKDSGLVSKDQESLNISDFIENISGTIGEDAFSGVNIGANTSIVIPGGITSIGDGAFAVVDEKGDIVAGKAPGLDITIPGSAIAKAPEADTDQGLDDIFMGSVSTGTGDDLNRPAYFGDVTITGSDDNTYTGDILTGYDDSTTDNPSAGVDIVISGKLDFSDGLTSFDGNDLKNVGIPDKGEGNNKLPITVPENTTVNGTLSEGPMVVDVTGDIKTDTNGNKISGTPVFDEDNNESSFLPPVTTINDGMFAGREDITVLVIPADMTKIGEGAFAGCTNLQEIIFEGERKESITIADGAFAGCTSLDKISYREEGKEETEGDGVAWFPENTVTDLNANVFKDTGFTSVKLDSSMEVADETAFSKSEGSDAPTFEITLPVEGFMNEKEYPENGNYPSDAVVENVTFSGTWPNLTGVKDSDKNTAPEKYGYDYTWQINGKDVIPSEGSSSVTISDIVSTNANSGNGGTIKWTKKTWSTTVKVTGASSSEEKSIDIKFEETLPTAEDLKNSYSIPNYTVKSVTYKYNGEVLSAGEKLTTDLGDGTGFEVIIEYEPISATIEIDGVEKTIYAGKSWLENGFTTGVNYASSSDGSVLNSGHDFINLKETVTEEDLQKFEDGINSYYQYNGFGTGVSASVGNQAITSGQFVANKSQINLSVDSGSIPSGWNSGNSVVDSTGKVVASVKVEGSMPSGPYYPVWETSISVSDGNEQIIKYSDATGFNNTTFSDLGLSNSDGAVFVFSDEDSLDANTNGIDLSDSISPTTVNSTTGKEINKYYKVNIVGSSNSTSLYKAGLGINSITGFDHVYVSKTAYNDSDTVPAESTGKSVGSDTLNVYQIHKIVFSAGEHGSLGNGTKWYLHDKLITADDINVTAEKGYDLNPWSNLGKADSDKNFTATYTAWTYNLVFRTKSPNDDWQTRTENYISMSINGVNDIGHFTVSDLEGQYEDKDENNTTQAYGEIKFDNVSYKDNLLNDYVAVQKKTDSTYQTKDGPSARFLGWTDENGNDITSIDPSKYSKGETITLYAKWKPLRIVLGGLCDFVNGDNYEEPNPETRQVIAGYDYKASPYMREGDTLNISGTSGNYIVTVTDGAGKTFMKFTSSYNGVLPSKVSFDSLLNTNYTCAYQGNITDNPNAYQLNRYYMYFAVLENSDSGKLISTSAFAVSPEDIAGLNS